MMREKQLLVFCHLGCLYTLLTPAAANHRSAPDRSTNHTLEVAHRCLHTEIQKSAQESSNNLNNLRRHKQHKQRNSNRTRLVTKYYVFHYFKLQINEYNKQK